MTRRGTTTPPRPWALLLVAILGAGCLAGPAPADDTAPQRFLVSTSHPEATAVGIATLAAGGNAMDAAAAVQFALNVVEPMMSGIGGGAFILLWDAEAERLVALDGRETAPADATPDMFQRALLTSDFPDAERGIAVGTPGTLAVWERALRDHGTRPLEELLEPAILLAEDGFVVDEVTSEYIGASADKLRRSGAAASLFLPGAECPPPEAEAIAVGDELVTVSGEGGEPLAPGARLVQPRLAEALHHVARDGPAALYGGPLGEGLVAAVGERGGILDLTDLSDYEVVEREPLVLDWRGLRVASLGHPSGGPTLSEALAILEPLDVAPRLDPAAAHNAIEAMHLAFADRVAYHGDPSAATADPSALLDASFVAARRALIDPARTGAPFVPGELTARDDSTREPLSSRSAVASGFHTTHFTVMDDRGNIVAVTSTIESAFGSGIFVPQWGFFANNEMTDFDLEPGGPNEIGPNKRPLSAMSPTIVFDHEGPVLALGSPGGPSIPGTVLQVMLDVLVGGTSLQAAVEAPRWASLLDAELIHEADMDAELLGALSERGHELRGISTLGGTVGQIGVIGGVQAIHRDPDVGWVATADPRRAGSFGSFE